MLGFFTDPYPDELLYSACARYSERTRYPNYKTNLRVLFGSQKYSAVVDLPTRLNTFISFLPEGNLYIAEKLINENTLFPFYEPFLPNARAEIVRQEMASDSDNKIHVRLGIRVKQLNAPDYLRFCPLCVDEDRYSYGETYWHRMHQLAGILVCPNHKCFLENSCLKWDRKVGYQFYLAEQFIINTFPRYLNEENPDQKILLRVAQDAQWLLSQRQLQIGPEIIRHRYFNRLLKLGFAYYKGRLRHEKFFEACDEFFSPKFFEMTGRASNGDNWLSALVQKSNTHTIYHPIRHLLLLNFLGLSAEEFFNSYIEFKAFGEPPYPCLNPSSKHYGELKIQECKILDNISKDVDKQGIPLGIFSCNCGFTYQRLGPDKTEKDKFTYSLVKEYGKTWEDKLTELWVDLTLSISKIGELLGVSELSVIRHAIRLNLPMNTSDSRIIQGYDKYRNPNKSFSEMRTQYRQEWLKILKENSQASRQELMDISNFHYLWFRRNDSDWIEEHLPEPQKVSRNSDILDWEMIDLEVSREVEKVCNEILSINEFPVRVSITEIINRTGYKTWIEKREKKLPLTTEIINRFLEEPEDYMIRKVKWAEEEFLKEGRIPTRLQFTIKAVVRNKTSTSAKVQKAIDESLARLKGN